ncbi:MAG TPA: hypothetical protein VK492_05765 [Chitinophagaceae bacterium]|nr:hypothetical protein [Chitinophagaceae bacterium]
MQLQAIKQVLDESIPNLKTTRQDQERQGNKYYLYSNLDAFRKAVNKLKKANLFIGLITQLENSDLFRIGGDQISIHSGVGNQIEDNIARLKMVAENLNAALTDIVGPLKENTINIKLPQISDFQDLSLVSRDLQNVIGQVVINDHINGTVEITSVENGSIWIEVFLGSHLAVLLIARISKVANSIYQRILENQILTGKARQSRLEGEINEQILIHESKMISLLIEVETKAIQNEFFKNDEPELTKRIEQSISTLKNLMVKGTEIHPALTAPKEMKSEFPNHNLLKSLTDQLKLLTDPNSQSADAE